MADYDGPDWDALCDECKEAPWGMAYGYAGDGGKFCWDCAKELGHDQLFDDDS